MKNLWCHPGLRSSSRRRGSIHLVFALFLAFFFVACSDDDSDFAVRPSDGSSSSVCEDCDDGSSSSAKSSSSSEYERVQCNVKTDENCIKDDRDGQTYKTVKIGDQWWMAENLNFETDSSFCYNKEKSNCAKYGRLYRWPAAVGKSESECGYGKTCSLPSGNIQGVCPSGWHLPSKAEWDTLFNAVGGQLTAGKVLKSTSRWESNGNGTDSFGFSALPAGYRLNHGAFSGEGNYATFWSSTEDDSDYAYNEFLGYSFDSASLNNGNKSNGCSVRCLKD